MLREGIFEKQRRFDKGVSYRAGDLDGKLFDAKNLLLINGKIQTRNGIRKFNSEPFTSSVLSMSYYAKNDGTTKKILSKASTVLSASSTDGVFSSIKTGLTSTTKHDAVTMNGRHIIAIENDGLYSYDGTTFAELGVDAPGAPSVAAAAGGSLSVKTYQVAVTFECESTGFETNQGTASANVATSGGDLTIAVTSIPVSTHPLVTHKNVYLKNVTDSGNFLFVGQITNATTSLNITTNPAATAATPPTGKDKPLTGGAKYLAIFNSQIVSSGNANNQSDVYFSNVNEPDGWSTSNTLVVAQGNGPVTALAVGYFSDSQLNQYLAVFKKMSITIYFQDLSGASNDSQIIINNVGCESHRSIQVKDGVIYFQSSYGWRKIVNGRLEKKTLADGDIDDIFKQSGWTYGVNKQQLRNSFSVYYGETDSYMCWVAEGASTEFQKCYNYHVDKDQFMPLVFDKSTCAVSGEDPNGEETIYIGRSDGNIYSYNIRNDYIDRISEGFDLDVDQLDVDELDADTDVAIQTQLFFDWSPEDGNYDVTYNIRDLFLEAISESSSALSTIAVKAYLNFNRSTFYEYSYDFYNQTGFTLDVSMLDVDSLADDRSRSRIKSDINRSCRNILFGITQEVENALFQLLAYQINYSKNGNDNI